MATVKADSGREENNNRVTFPRGTGAGTDTYTHNLFNSSPSQDQSRGSGAVVTSTTQTAVSGKFGGSQTNQIIAGTNQNTIAGSPSTALQGTKQDNINHASFVKGVDTFNIGSLDCEGGQTYAIFTLPGSGFGGCGCWVNTGADLLLLLGAGKGLATKFGKFWNATRGKSLIEAEKAARRGIRAAIQRELDSGVPGKFGKRIGEVWQKVKGRKISRSEWRQQMKNAMSFQKTQTWQKQELADLTNDQFMSFFATFGYLGAFTAVALGATGIYRKKVCLGQNTFLNTTTCECECLPGKEAFANGNLEDTIQSNIYGAASFIWDSVASVVVQADEFRSCCDVCNGCLNERVFGFTGTCDCVCNPTSSEIRSHYGIHVDAADDCPFERTLVTDATISTDACCCSCPDGSDVKEGRTKPTLARLSDNLSDPSVGSTGHYLYQTGCNFVCDGRDYVGTWPPTCADGEVFDNRKNICECRPAGVCKEYAGDPYGSSFTGPDAVSDAIQFINDNTANCTSPYVHGYYYSDGDTIVAEVVGRLPELNEGGDQIGYEVITGYTSEAGCGPGVGRVDVCKTPQITHNYTWTACPTDGSSCPLTLSDEAFNYTYP